MRGFIPPRPAGHDREARYHQAIWDKSYGPASKLCNSSTVKVEETSRGIFFHAAAASFGGKKTTIRFPFQIILSKDAVTLPTPFEDESGDASWRTFRVRAGAILRDHDLMGTDIGYWSVFGTDNADENPDDPKLPDSLEYAEFVSNEDPNAITGYDFTVPYGQTWFVWIDATDPAQPFIDFGEEEPWKAEGVEAFHSWDMGQFYHLATIDCYTKREEGIAIVRQLRRADIPFVYPKLLRCTITSVNADDMICTPADITGPAITVKKPPELCHIGSEVVDGGGTVGYTYASSSDGNSHRTASGDGDDQEEVVIPIWRVGDVIWASRQYYEDPWVDDNRNGRAWCYLKPPPG